MLGALLEGAAPLPCTPSRGRAGPWAQGHDGSPWGDQTGQELLHWPRAGGKDCPPCVPSLSSPSPDRKLRHVGLSQSKVPSLPLTQVGDAGIWDQPHPIPSCHLRLQIGKYLISP